MATSDNSSNLNASNLAIFPDYGLNQMSNPFAFDPNYNLQSLPQQTTDSSLWNELGNSVSGAGSYIFDSAKGVWTSAKEGVLGAVTSTGEAVDSVVSRALMYGAIAIGVLLVAVWVIGKSGVLHDAAAIFLATR